MDKVYIRIPDHDPSRGYFQRRFAWRGIIFTNKWRTIDRHLAAILIDMEQSSGAPLFEVETDPAKLGRAVPRQEITKEIEAEKEKARKTKEKLLGGALTTTAIAEDLAGKAMPTVKKVQVEKLSSEEKLEEKPKSRKKNAKKKAKKEETGATKRRRKIKAPPKVNTED